MDNKIVEVEIVANVEVTFIEKLTDGKCDEEKVKREFMEKFKAHVDADKVDYKKIKVFVRDNES